jgi:hypothetical protein
MKKKYGYLLSAVLFFGTLACVAICTLITPFESYSAAERRNLASMPALSLNNVASGKWQNALESFLQDHIAFRSSFLTLQSVSNNDLFYALDDAGLISKDGSLIRVNETENEDSIAYAAKLFDSIEEQYLQNSACKVYLSIIPDKAYFVQDENYLTMDYEKFFQDALAALPQGKYIDITKTLSLEDYYSTDSHWKQESIIDTAAALASAMGVSIESDYEQIEALPDFEGSYSPLTALAHNKDSLILLENDTIRNFTVSSVSESASEKIDIYNMDKLQSSNPYEAFLNGNLGMVTIENPDAENDRELIVFKDSFGSSIAPLIAQGYKKTTLIDLRAMPSWRLKNLVEFTDQDVLFLYSTTSLNAATSMK